MNKESAASVPLGARRKDPFVFRTFLEMGLEESVSPFLNKKGQEIAKNLALKAALFSFLLLTVAFFCKDCLVSSFLVALVYLIAGVPSLVESIEDILFKRDINIDVLMTVAAFSAYFLGAAFEGALLLVLFSLSGALEELVTLKAKNALGQLHAMAPTKAFIQAADGQLYERAIEDIAVGTSIFVRAGEIVPLDGIVVSGESYADFKHLTGESRPIRKRVGDQVAAGARVIDGALTIEVTSLHHESTIAKLVALITKAEAAKPRLERWFDQFGRMYAISIISVSALSALFFYYALHLSLFEVDGAIYRALSFLIAASPCALILAVPIAYLSALGSLARRGIILKGGVVLDALYESEIVAFDKTGTLTLGNLALDTVDVSSNSAFSREELMIAAASLERNAVHPIAKAIVDGANGSALFPVKNMKVIPGYGVEGIISIHGKEFTAFVGDVKNTINPLQEIAKKRKEEGKIVALLTVGEASALFSFEDRPRPEMKEMLQAIRNDGRRCLMLTGDHETTAKHIAEVVGITEYYANLKPEDKLEKISQLSESHGLVMVGDGINDAPALARASVGIAMGQVGSQTAQAVADCVFVQDTIEHLDLLFKKAAKTRKIVRQNLAIALTAIVCAGTAALLGVVPLWLAVILHEGGTVLVGLNAIRLLNDYTKTKK